MTAHDYALLREEARILWEMLQTLPPNDPQVEAIMERGLELSRLGIEAGFLDIATGDKPAS